MEQKLVLTRSEYERFCQLIQERSGLLFTPDKQHTLERCLAEALNASQCRSLDEYYLMLRSSPSSSPEWDNLISMLTVGETYFFRHPGHFDALAELFLPELIARRRDTTRCIRIWSAGCATGEEPYSIAITLHRCLPDIRNWNILILATDINRAALNLARAGQYGPWSFRGVDKRLQERYFSMNGDKRYLLCEEIKRMVTFDYLNLVEDTYPSLSNNTYDMDVIFCRNVTIYFSPEVTQRIVRRFYDCLNEGGWLVPGASEPNMVTYQDFEHRNLPGAIVFRKPLSGQPSPKRSWVFSEVARPSKDSAELALQPPAIPVGVQPPAVQPPQTSVVEAEPLVQKASPVCPQALPTDPFEAAMALMQSGQIDQALVKLQEKVRRDPNFAPAYYALAKLHANRGNLVEALAYCKQAVEKDKLLLGAYYTLALIYQESGDWEQALEALKKALYLDRGFILAHYTLAHLYRKRGDLASAIKSLQNARRLLSEKAKGDLVPEGDGLVVGRLMDMIDAELASMERAVAQSSRSA